MYKHYIYTTFGSTFCFVIHSINEFVAYEISEAQGAKSAGKHSAGMNDQEHNVDIPEFPPNRSSEDECQFNTTTYDDLADMEECNSL